MPQQTNEEVVRAYLASHAVHDHVEQGRLRHPDWLSEWPQSGERVRGHASAVALDAAFPGGMPLVEPHRVVGSEDRWVVTPVYTVQRIVGSGDFWWGDGHITYPDGARWHLVMLLELRDGKVYRETAYFAEPFEAPAWRAPFVERMDGA